METKISTDQPPEPTEKAPHVSVTSDDASYSEPPNEKNKSQTDEVVEPPVDDGSDKESNKPEDVEYPKGLPLMMITIALMLGVFLMGLDTSIISTTYHTHI